MQVKQIYALVNTITEEVLGQSALVKEDLSDVVDLGETIFNSGKVDNYVKSLVDHIGKVVFTDRLYKGQIAPSVMMDGWEFGSCLEKLRMDLPEASEDESWNLVDKQSYDVNVFYQPTISAKFYNSKTTYEIKLSITQMQVKESFTNATQLNAFFSMIYAQIENSLAIKNDSLILRTIDNMIGQTFNAEMPSGTYTGVSSVKAVNLLYLYNQAFSKTLTRDSAMGDLDFLKFATKTISLYSDRMVTMSNLFNVGGCSRFTPKELQHIVLLSDFAKSADIYLQSDTYHNELVKLPSYESIPYFQGSGLTYALDDTSKINVTIKTGNNTTKDITASGIIGVIFDRDALGVTNVDKRVTSNYNARAEFYTNWYKCDASFFNDLNENFVVFYLA